MTSVSGHLTTLAFGPEIPKVWANGDPVHLFDAPVRTVIDMEVSFPILLQKFHVLTEFAGWTKGSYS